MTTPLRQQYLAIKRRHPGMLLLFQIGDFYETFDEDAHVMARELGVALTRKWFGKGDVRPLAGVPVRSLEAHLAKLIHRGHKVAVCDQVTLPGKGLVEREVVRVITPGTVMEPGLLSGRESNYLCSLVVDGDDAGLAYADVSTGEFAVTELPAPDALAEIERLGPAELLCPAGLRLQPGEASGAAALTALPDEQSALPAARQALLHHFSVATLLSHGCEDRPLCTRAAGALIAYLRDTQPEALTNLTGLRSYRLDRYMQLDAQAARSLEVLQQSGPGGHARPWETGDRRPSRWTSAAGGPGTLLGRIDQTVTSMGARLLRERLRRPLLDMTALLARQDALAWFLERDDVRAQARGVLGEVQDVERLLGRIRRRLAVPEELCALARSLQAAGRLRRLLERAAAPADFVAPLHPCAEDIHLIEHAIAERPPGDLLQGGVIRPGFSAELDELRATLSGGHKFVAELEARERQRTGIRSLRVSYNKVFGYYIEVTRPNLRLVPGDYIRKQTLSGGERFFTLELKEHETTIANARDRILELEGDLYRQVCDRIGAHHERLGEVARGLGRIDLHAALAECARRLHYVRPELCEGDELHIVQGRHPMLEQVEGAPPFVPNDTFMAGMAGGGARGGEGGAQIMLITAPNMAGKSVYLRQVALICLLAQIGSYVPAAEARVGLIDRIFTRVGLNDDTLRGHSSFMSEMVETAHILHHATRRSLVLLDEVGRGTATADGLALARAIIEYLHNHPRLGAKTLFATHYHELTACAGYLPRVRNYHLAVREEEGRITYLHRVEPGQAERSFGLHVAQLAGLPRPVLRRAQELLGEHERGARADVLMAAEGPAPYGGAGAVLDDILDLDINAISPVEALTKLYALQVHARGVRGR